MKKLNQFIRKYFFNFSVKEANGFVVLIVLAGILLITPSILRFFPQTASTPEEIKRDEELTVQTLAELEIAEKEYQTKKKTKKQDYKKNPSKFNFQLFQFNPNEIHEKDWEKLGLKDYLAKRIEKYKSKGGSFKYKSDLQKIYGFPDWLYLKLEPYILLPEKSDSEDNLTKNESSENTNFSPTSYSKKYVIEPFDINVADTATLRQVRGVGAVLSERIVKFRDKLGGFHSLNQLQDVYGLSPETQTELLKFAELQNSNYQKIKVNIADLNALKKHPYISYKIAKVIVNYRTHHGNYMSSEDLKKIKVLDSETLQKIAPYLSFE